MVRPLIVTLLTLLLAEVASADLHLMPSSDEYLLDGVKLRQLAFADGDRKVTYQSPRGWEYSGSATQLTLHPGNKSQAEATISRVPQSSESQFDDDTLKKLVAEAVALVPKGSKNVTIDSQEKTPLKIGRRETFLLVLRYTVLDTEYNRSILFVNREADQIRCQLICRSSDFKELQKAFLDSQYSWRNL